MIGQSAPTSDVARFAEQITGLARRVRELELAAASGRGWVPIDSGSVSAVSSFSITVPSGCQDLRLRMKGHTSELANVTCRINNDTTSELHERAFTVINPDGTIATSIGDLFDRWMLSRWGARVGANSLEATFFDVSSNSRVTCMSAGHRRNGDRSVGFGSLESARIVTSLRVFPNVGTVTANWTLEGYRA